MMSKLDLIKSINDLTIFELNSIINELKEKFKFKLDLKTTAQTVKDNIVEDSVKPKFSLILTSVKAEKKISLLKTIKVILNLGLKEAKDLIEKTPSIIKQDIFFDEINELKTQIESAGGIVQVEKTS